MSEPGPAAAARPTGAGRPADVLDALLPHWRYRTRHGTQIRAAAPSVYRALRRLDCGDAPAVRCLFRLRGLPPAALSLDGLIAHGFSLLADEPPERLVLGVVGRLWAPRPVLEQMDAADFRAFSRAGYVKLVWGFHCAALTEDCTRLTTETRALATDAWADLHFLPYWYAIRPFSGWLRRRMLRRVRTEAATT